ncbi:MAG: L,D-transpeptidase family protein [Planctomycetes bacterium]|nr:L,D-transpeptidase family protein [Planctomycetota bacterium]
MRTEYQRRSPVTWIVWGLAFVTMTALMAWKFHWLPGDENEAVLVNEGGAEEGTASGKDAEGKTSKGKQTDQDDEFVFDLQNEPGAKSPPDFHVRDDLLAHKAPHTLNSQHPWDYNRRLDERQPIGEAGSGVRSAGHRAELRNSDPRTGGSVRSRQPSNVIQSSFESLNRKTDSSPPVDTLGQIDRLIASGDILAAHKILSRIYWKKPQWRAAIHTRIEKTANSIYFSPTRHYMPPYVVQENEFLSTIASKYNISSQYLAWLNRTTSGKVRAGQKLKVLNGPFSAMLDFSDREITIHQRGWYVARFQIGIGRDGRTPIGKRTVLTMMKYAPYTGQDEFGRDYDIPSGDPRNPTGSRWISIGNSYAIHGTNDPNSIGNSESEGWIRLRNADVEIIYDLLQRGSEVVIQP